MKVFVSHSMKDQSILKGIQSALEPHQIQLLIAEHTVDMQNTISQKIKNFIESCHVGLVLLTKNGINSGFVREEIGYLEAKQKPSLVIFEKGIEKEYGGFKYGYDYVELNPDLPNEAVEKTKSILLNYWMQLIMQNHRARQEELKRKKEKENALIALGILAGIVILGSK